MSDLAAAVAEDQRLQRVATGAEHQGNEARWALAKLRYDHCPPDEGGRHVGVAEYARQAKLPMAEVSSYCRTWARFGDRALTMKFWVAWDRVQGRSEPRTQHDLGPLSWSRGFLKKLRKLQSVDEVRKVDRPAFIAAVAEIRAEFDRLLPEQEHGEVRRMEVVG